MLSVSFSEDSQGIDIIASMYILSHALLALAGGKGNLVSDREATNSEHVQLTAQHKMRRNSLFRRFRLWGLGDGVGVFCGGFDTIVCA